MKYFLILFVVAILFSGCSETQEAEWTILIYMAADNGLNNAALSDINEMENSIFSDNINIIVQIDNNQYNQYPGAVRYHVYPDTSDEITSKIISLMGEIDSGDYNTLTSFANWGFNKYPSEKKALVIWSHGNGWYDYYNRFCPDHESGSSIDIPDGDLRNALERMNSKLDIMILDACFMQTIEVLTEAYQYAYYIISSEDVVPTDGFPYDIVFTAWEDYLSSEILASELVGFYLDSYLPGGSQNSSVYYIPVTCSAVKTSRFPTLLNDLSDFTVNWTYVANSDYFTQARNNCLEFNDLDSDIDIKEFFYELTQQDIPEELDELSCNILENIEDVFIAQGFIDYMSESIGTAILWYPESQYIYDDLLNEYQQLEFSNTGWQIFLENTFR
jgi:hypothetical protein